MMKIAVLSALVAAASASFSSDMCSLCVSFLDQTEKSDLFSVRSNMLDAASCEKSCGALESGEGQMSCSLLCDHVGADTFASLIDVSDYVGAQSMCDSHQVCERDDALAAIQLDMQMMALSQQANATKAKPGNVTVNGDLTVTGSLKTKSIRSSALTVNGSITVTHAVRTEFLKADNAKSSVVETSTVSSPTGSVTLTGNLAMQNTAANAAPSLSAAELHTNSLIQLGVRQWQLVHHDDFEKDHSDWKSSDGSFVELSSCSAGDSFMGGHCKLAGDTVKKTYNDLPEHSFLRVQAKYHFIDSWEGETAFMKVDGKHSWTESTDTRNAPSGIDMCGGSHPERKFAHPIDVIIPHTDASVMLELGSSLDEHACNESFGVDDVMISIK